GVAMITFAPETISIKASVCAGYGSQPRSTDQSTKASKTESGSGSAGIRSASSISRDPTRTRGRPGSDVIRDVVAAAILDDLSSPSRLLAARRSRPAELAGRWELPGGKVDQGETATAALVREITEELGVTIEPGGELGAGSDWMISPTWRLRVWP